MNKRDELELAEFEKSLTNKNYTYVALITLGVLVVGVGSTLFVFSLISAALSSLFGG